MVQLSSLAKVKINAQNVMFHRRHLVALKRRGLKTEAEVLELRLTAYDDDQTHVGEHEQITVNIPHKNDRQKLVDKVARVQHVIKEKVMKQEQPQNPERGPTTYDEQASFSRIKVDLRSVLAGIYNARLPWVNCEKNETAAPTEGKSHSFMGHKGLNLHELQGVVSHFRNHTGADVKQADVHKTLIARGYKHLNTENHKDHNFKMHVYKHSVLGDRVHVTEREGKVGFASHRYGETKPFKYSKGADVHALPAGTKVHTPWVGEEDENGTKPDGHHYPATYVKQNANGSHRIKWDADGWGEQDVSQLHPDSVHKYHK